jgi:hypothetical protein
MIKCFQKEISDNGFGNCPPVLFIKIFIICLFTIMVIELIVPEVGPFKNLVSVCSRDGSCKDTVKILSADTITGNNDYCIITGDGSYYLKCIHSVYS